MNIKLVRYAYCHNITLGSMAFDGEVYMTIERPWIKSLYSGGEPFKSCIPEGRYACNPFVRSSGTQALSLSNPELGVWVNRDDRCGSFGRYQILCHSGNWVDDVVGCIAIGLGYKIDSRGRHMVTNSRQAMSRLIADVSCNESVSLTIEQVNGAKD